MPTQHWLPRGLRSDPDFLSRPLSGPDRSPGSQCWVIEVPGAGLTSGVWSSLQSFSTFRTLALYVYMDNLKLEYIRIASHQYEGWEVLWSAVCELESQGRWTYSFSWNQRPENQKKQRYKFQYDSESLWTRSADGVTSSPKAEEDHVLTHSVRQRVNSPFLCLFILLRTSPDWITSTHTREGKLFTQSINSNVTLIQKHPQRHIQKV